MVGTKRRKDNKVDIPETPSSVPNRAADGLRRQRRRAFALGGEPALADATPLDNPIAGNAQKPPTKLQPKGSPQRHSK